MAKAKKLSELELTKIQSMLNSFNQLKMQLGDAELQKVSIVAQIEKLKSDYSVVEKELSDKYGIDNQIDVKTGEVKPNEKTLEKVK